MRLPLGIVGEAEVAPDAIGRDGLKAEVLTLGLSITGAGNWISIVWQNTDGSR